MSIVATKNRSRAIDLERMPRIILFPLIIEGPKASLVSQQSIGQGAAEFNELWLRDQLFEHPKVLPFDSIDASFAHSVPICREMRTDAGSIDAVFANEHGLLTILECKLWRNPEARREVVGQVLDYARALARLSYEELSLKVNSALKSQGNRLFELVRQHHPDLLEHVWIDQVSRNLAQGRFLLLVAGDGIREGVVAITEQLQRGVGLRFHFGLVEVAVFKQERATILQPRLLARTVTVERSVVRVESNLASANSVSTVAVLDVDEAEADRDPPSSALAATRKNFWADFVSKVRLEGGVDATPKRLQQNSAKARLPLGQWITAYRGESVRRIGLWFEARGAQASEITRHLTRHRAEIESEIGVPVEWSRREGGEVLIASAREETDFESPKAITAQQKWLALHLQAYTRALGPRLRALEESIAGRDE